MSLTSKEKIIVLCGNVLGMDIGDNTNCEGLSCYGDNCPFRSIDECGKITIEMKEVAKEYIGKHSPVKEEIKTKKTFREVIVDIKKGEVWEEKTKSRQLHKIYINELGNISFEYIGVPCSKVVKGEDNVEGTTWYDLVVDATEERLFTLQRKEYTFEEAFKAYEDGKVIESLVDKQYKHKLIDEKPYYKTKNIDWTGFDKESSLFSLNEIKGKWYINN